MSATQGFSPRTRNDAQLIRFGERAARIAVRGTRGTVPLEIELTLETGAGKRAKLNGAPLRAAEQLRSETATLVFTPDRLGVVKGAPAARRAYFDRVARPPLACARAPVGGVRRRGRAAQRVAAPRRRRLLVARRARAVDGAGRRSSGRSSSPRGRRRSRCSRAPFAERAGELGLPDARAALRRRAAVTVADARGASRPRPRARRHRARPAPRRRRPRRRRAASCAASARRASSGSRCSRSSSPRRS